MLPRIGSLLGLAQRAGKVVSGDAAVRRAIFKDKVTLVVMAVDTATNTREMIRDNCLRKSVPLVYIGTKNELGQVLGKAPRAVAALLEQRFASQILAAMGDGKIDN
ncbi:MAG: L7Ae/L30e/S12e/Gadd45 family ribosomal protein [Bacillota bacterium]